MASVAITASLLFAACVTDQVPGVLTTPDASATTTTSAAPAARALRSPSGPPARMCGSAALAGPSRAPRGAVVVTTSRSLPDLVSNRRAGTTFWLAPGRHHLGSGQYDQVRPKNGDVFIGAPGAVIDGQNKNLYAFAGRATDVVITHLTIQNFGSAGDNNNEGVVNHDAGHGWRITHNTIQDNAGAGVFVGSLNKVISNCLRDNRQYGLSAYESRGVRRVLVRHNEISGNNTDNWEERWPGCGCTGGAKFWDTRLAVVTDNWVHHNHGPGLWADTNNTGFLFEGNYFSDNDGQGLFYEISYNAAIVRNTFVRNGLVEGPLNTGFPTGAIYLSESGSDRRAGATYGRQLRVAGNRFVDNWAGIMAWENSDRFAGSPANSSSGYTTLVNPSATEDACSTPSLISRQPYLSDCRWKVKNLKVTNNRFVFRPDRIGAACTEEAGCGYMGVFSNYGTYPSWSPYQAYVVPNNITFAQRNVWSKNSYDGPWRFMIHTLWHKVSWRTWRGGRFKQDAGSVRR